MSRESQLPAHEFDSWNVLFLEMRARGLDNRAVPAQRKATLSRAKIGELITCERFKNSLKHVVCLGTNGLLPQNSHLSRLPIP